MERSIHLVFKTHLDVGFTDYASTVVRNYFKKYIPSALRVRANCANPALTGSSGLRGRG